MYPCINRNARPNNDQLLTYYQRVNLNLRMRRSLVKLLGVVESVAKVVTGCLGTTKVDKFVEIDQKGFSKNMENIGLCLNFFFKFQT